MRKERRELYVCVFVLFAICANVSNVTDDEVRSHTGLTAACKFFGLFSMTRIVVATQHPYKNACAKLALNSMNDVCSVAIGAREAIHCSRNREKCS